MTRFNSSLSLGTDDNNRPNNVSDEEHQQLVGRFPAGMHWNRYSYHYDLDNKGRGLTIFKFRDNDEPPNWAVYTTGKDGRRISQEPHTFDSMMDYIEQRRNKMGRGRLATINRRPMRDDFFHDSVGVPGLDILTDTEYPDTDARGSVQPMFSIKRGGEHGPAEDIEDFYNHPSVSFTEPTCETCFLKVPAAANLGTFRTEREHAGIDHPFKPMVSYPGQRFSNTDATSLAQQPPTGAPQTSWKPYDSTLDVSEPTHDDVQKPTSYTTMSPSPAPPVGSANGADAVDSNESSDYWKTQRYLQRSKISNIRDLPEYGEKDWPYGDERVLDPRITTRPYSQDVPWNRIFDDELVESDFPDREDYAHSGHFMSLKDGGESGPSEDTNEPYFYDPSDSHEINEAHPLPHWMRRSSVVTHADWKSRVGVFNSDNIDQLNPGEHRTHEWREHQIGDEDFAHMESQVPGQIDYMATGRMPEGMLAWSYLPDEHLDGPVGRYGDRWPEESAWEPTKENMTTGVVQPMIDPGSRRDSLSGPGHVLDSHKDLMEWKHQPEEGDPFYRGPGLRRK